VAVFAAEELAVLAASLLRLVLAWFVFVGLACNLVQLSCEEL
jgi:hypothetical protein